MMKCIECGSEDIVAFVKLDKIEFSDGSGSPPAYVAVCKKHYDEYMEID